MKNYVLVLVALLAIASIGVAFSRKQAQAAPTGAVPEGYRLRAMLEIDRDRLQPRIVRAEADNGSKRTVAAMVAELRATDDEYVIVKLRRILGPIKVMPGLARAQCALQWNEEPNLSHATG